MIPFSSQFAAANQPSAMPVVMLTLGGYSRIFTTGQPGAGVYPWIAKAGSVKCDARDTDGSSSISQMSMTILDYAKLITQDFPSIPSGFKGMTATVQIGFQGLATAYWPVIATLVVDRVASDKDNTAYTFRLRDQSVIMQQQVYQYGNNPNYYTSSNNPLTVGPANPLDILTEILAQTQPALAANAAAVAAYKAGLMAGRLVQFNLSQSEQASSFIAGELFKPFGGYWFFNYAGLVTPYYWIPFAPPAAVCALDQSNLVSVPVADEADLINQIDMTMDYSSSSFGAEDIEFDADSFQLYNLIQSASIDARGQKTNFGAWGWNRLMAHNYFLRYGFFNRKYNLTCMRSASALATSPALQTSPLALEVGDHIYLSHPNVPNRVTGTMTLTNLFCEVLSVSKDLDKFQAQVTVLDKSWLAALTPYQVAPDGTPVYASASSAQQAEYAYIASAASEQFSTGATGQEIY